MTEDDLMTGRVKGRLTQAGNTASAPCELFIIEGQVSLEMANGDITPVGSARDLIFHSRHDMPRKITLPDGSVFETQQTAAFDAMAPKDLSQKAARFQEKVVAALPKAALFAAGGFVLFKVLTPVLINAAIAMTPDSAVRMLNDMSEASLDGMFEATTLPMERREEVRDIFTQLVEARQRKAGRELDYNLLFRDGGDMGANALAMPGGTIVVTDDLVDRHGEDHVLAAVLAHEIGHVENQHSLKQLYKTAGLMAAVSIVLGNNSTGLNDLVQGGANVMTLSFSRDHEMESDNYSYDLLKSTGNRTDGLIDFFNQMEEAEDLPNTGEWMHTHPLGKNRIRNIERRRKRDGQDS